MANDLYDEMAEFACAMATVTTRLSSIHAETAPSKDDTAGRLEFALDQLSRYRIGVRDMHQLLHQKLDAALAAGEAA